MDITKAFISGIKYCEEYNEALDIVKKNSSGKIWLIGGFVFRTIASQLYGVSKPVVDLDFVVDNNIPDFNLPNNWVVDNNRFGNPKLLNGKKQIDYVPLCNIYSIIQRQLEPTIENFLSGAPLTIQSIAYDVYENKIIGDQGVDALQRKVIEINNLSFAEYAAKKKNKSLQEMIQEKANDLGFEAIFPK